LGDARDVEQREIHTPLRLQTDPFLQIGSFLALFATVAA
jgi:hypothetical protein